MISFCISVVPPKVTANAFSAGFHRIAHFVFPVPVGSRDPDQPHACQPHAAPEDGPLPLARSATEVPFALV